MRQSPPTTAASQGTSEAPLPGCAGTVGGALEEWDQHCARCGASSRGIIRILDNGVYDEAPKIRLPSGAHLSIVADTGVRPIVGKRAEPIVVHPDPATQSGTSTQAERRLDLNGLFLLGGLRLDLGGENDGKSRLILAVEHCTLAKFEEKGLAPAPIQSAQAARELALRVEHSILGPLYLPETTASVRVSDSIVDNGSGYAIAADRTGAQPGPALELERVTLLGRVHARQVAASEVIFVGPLRAPAPETEEQIQHSYVSQGSTTPDGRPHPSISEDVAPPRFTSTRYGDPAYGQLALDCPREILGGAADGSEVGAFHDRYPLQAEANLRAILDEYLPLGMHASIFYVT